MRQCHLLWDTLCDVNLSSEAADTEVSRVGVNGSATLAAENLAKLPRQLGSGQGLHLNSA